VSVQLIWVSVNKINLCHAGIVVHNTVIKTKQDKHIYITKIIILIIGEQLCMKISAPLYPLSNLDLSNFGSSINIEIQQFKNTHDSWTSHCFKLEILCNQL